jgi:hypothetical protein
MRTTLLILASKTLPSDELFATLEARAAQADIRVEFVVPPDRLGADGRAAAQSRLDKALARASAAGIEATGKVADPDPLTSVAEAYDARRHDEIIVCTLPASTSHWIGIDLPARIAHVTNALVTHVAVHEPRPPVTYEHVEPAPGPTVLAPLQVLGWGKRSHGSR